MGAGRLLARRAASTLPSMLFEVCVILGLVLTNGLFAGAEIAVVGMDRTRLRQLVDDGHSAARAVQALRSDPERFFATVQIVITVVSAAAGAFGGARFAHNLVPLLEPLVGPSADELALGLVVAGLSYLSLVLGELVPKSLALRNSQGYALLIAPFLLGLGSVARPMVWLLTRSSNVFLRLFGDRATFAESRLSRHELRELVDEAAEHGALDARVGKIAARAFDFAELNAGQCLVSRTRVVALPRNASRELIQSVVLESAHSRLPVYEGDLDHVVGYVFYKDLLPLAWEGKLFVLEDLLRAPFFVTESMPASQLLQEMRERRTHLAFVADEQGGLAGIVTLDDLIEELVGEIFGERRRSEPRSMQRDTDGSVLAQAEVAVREVNREFSLNLPESQDYSTLGGLSASLAGRVPRPGERYRTSDGTEILVEAASDRAATRVRILPATPPVSTKT